MHLDSGLNKTSKYDRTMVCKKTGTKVVVDVYSVLKAFKKGCPAIDHAVKKLLAPGKRGVKSTTQDLKEAIQSIERAIELAIDDGVDEAKAKVIFPIHGMGVQQFPSENFLNLVQDENKQIYGDNVVQFPNKTK